MEVIMSFIMAAIIGGMVYLDWEILTEKKRSRRRVIRTQSLPVQWEAQ